MQLFSKKNAKCILAILVAICLAGCATNAPVDEVVVTPVIDNPVVVVEETAPAPAPVVVETPAVEPVVEVAAPAVVVDYTPVVESVESVVKSFVKSQIASDSEDATLDAVYEIAGYNLIFSAVDNELVFNYLDTFSADEEKAALDALASLLPNVEAAKVKAPGSMVFTLSDAVSEDVFNAFVNAVADKAYMAIYAPNAVEAKAPIAVPEGKVAYAADFDLVGYSFSFEAVDNAVVFKYIDSLSAVQNSIIADNIAASLDNVVEYGIAAPGCVVVELGSPISKAAFDALVANVKAKAYDAIYPNATKATAKVYAGAPEGVATYKSIADVAGYRLSFSSIGKALVFNYVNTLSADEAENALRNLSAMLPNVASCEVAAPGSMVFYFNAPIAKSAFNNFVDAVTAKAYDAVYPNPTGNYEAKYEMYGYNFIFVANDDVVEFKFVDALSSAQKEALAAKYAALLPNVDSTTVSVGKIEFQLADTISSYAFDKFVAAVELDIANKLYPINYKTTCNIAGYPLVFSAVNNVVVFNYMDSLSDVDLRDAVLALADMLPNVVDYGVAGPGIMVFEMTERVAKDVFDGFVAEVSEAAYDYIY